MTAPAVKTDDTPDTPCPAYQRMKPFWDLCQDVRGGTPTIRARASRYLPKFEAEDPRDYEQRVGLTTVFDAFAQTIGTMVGLAGGEEPTLQEDVPKALVEIWEDIDGEGTHGSIFAMEALDKALETGHHLILVDHPTTPEMTLAARRAQGVRPYFVHVAASQVKNWRIGKHGGHRYLAQVVIEQVVSREKGLFGSESVTQYRVFTQQFTVTAAPFVQWELWQQGADGKVVRIGNGVLVGPRWIPVAVVYGGEKVNILESTPPLLGLAYSNIRHAQVESDFASYLHKCGQPTVVFIGRDTTGEDIVLGRGVDVAIGGDAKLLELAGTSLSAMREEKRDLEKQMVAQGLSLLQRDIQQAETATAHRLNKVRDESKLARACRSLQDALESCFGFAAAYLGEADGGSLQIRRDFGALTLTDGELQQLTQIRDRGDLTLETFLRFLRAKGGVFAELDPAKEAEAVRRESALDGIDLGSEGALAT